MFLCSASGLTARAQARDLLALAVHEVWGLSPLPEIARRPGGKPFFSEREDLHFNLSHSGDLALCALDGAPVGADIQIIKEWRPSLPRRVCSAEELAWLEEQPDLPAELSLVSVEELGSPQQSGGVAVVAAGVHDPLLPGTVAQLPVLLLNGQGVDVRP